jgi:hypothetical protein
LYFQKAEVLSPYETSLSAVSLQFDIVRSSSKGQPFGICPMLRLFCFMSALRDQPLCIYYSTHGLMFQVLIARLAFLYIFTKGLYIQVLIARPAFSVTVCKSLFSSCGACLSASICNIG